MNQTRDNLIVSVKTQIYVNVQNSETRRYRLPAECSVFIQIPVEIISLFKCNADVNFLKFHLFNLKLHFFFVQV